MTVVVQLPAFFQKVELDPVVEARHFPTLDFTCSVEGFSASENLYRKKKSSQVCVQTCKDVLETTGVHLVVVAGVQPEPHHLQVLNEGFLRWINAFNRQETNK